MAAATNTKTNRYQCTKCYHYFSAAHFSVDSQNGHRDFLACWCKKCVSEGAKKTQLQKRIEERKRKAKIAKELALSHPLITSFFYQESEYSCSLEAKELEAEDLGDIGIKLIFTNPMRRNDPLAIKLKPSKAHELSQWINRSNEGKLSKER